MKDLNEATQKICELKGTLFAMECLISAMAITLPPGQRLRARAQLQVDTEACRTMLLGALISEHTLQQFEHDARRLSTSLD